MGWCPAAPEAAILGYFTEQQPCTDLRRSIAIQCKKEVVCGTWWVAGAASRWLVCGRCWVMVGGGWRWVVGDGVVDAGQWKQVG